MVPYAVQTGDISQEAYKMFCEMHMAMWQLPNFQFDPPLSCHVICRAFAENYSAECVDGYFVKGSEHSWLVLDRYNLQDHGKDALVIADLYPCRGGTPFLVYKDWSLSWAYNYIEDPSVIAYAVETPEFYEQVTEVATAVALLKQEFEEARHSI